MRTRCTLMALAAMVVFAAAGLADDQQYFRDRDAARDAGRNDPAHGFDDLRYNPDYRRGANQPAQPPVSRPDPSRYFPANERTQTLASASRGANGYEYATLQGQVSVDVLHILGEGRQALLPTGDVWGDPASGMAYCEVRPVTQVVQYAQDGSWTTVVVGPAFWDRLQ